MHADYIEKPNSVSAVYGLLVHFNRRINVELFITVTLRGTHVDQFAFILFEKNASKSKQNRRRKNEKKNIRFYFCSCRVVLIRVGSEKEKRKDTFLLIFVFR